MPDLNSAGTHSLSFLSPFDASLSPLRSSESWIILSRVVSIGWRPWGFFSGGFAGATAALPLPLLPADGEAPLESLHADHAIRARDMTTTCRRMNRMTSLLE